MLSAVIWMTVQGCVKNMLSLCMPWKAYRGSTDITPPILSLSTRSSWVVLFISHPQDTTAVPTEQEALWAPQPAWTLSLIALAFAECDNSLPFSGPSSIPLCYVLFPATLLHQLFIHSLSPHLAIYFLVYLSTLFFPNLYIILFWEFYLLPFSVHAQTNVIYVTLLSLL